MAKVIGTKWMSRSWAAGSHKGWRKVRQRILQRDQSTCQLCGQTEGQLHIDHIIPKRLNGSDLDDNLRVLCQSCNLRRGGSFFEHDRTPPTLHELFTPMNVSKSHD